MTARRRRDELFTVWAAARADANLAYDAWCRSRSREDYAVYRALEDQADAAEGDLAEISLLLALI